MKSWLLKWVATLLVRLLGACCIGLGTACAIAAARQSSWAMVAKWWGALGVVVLLAAVFVGGGVCLCAVKIDD